MLAGPAAASDQGYHRRSIPCAHKKNGVSTAKTVSDYHPLGIMQIRRLVARAKAETRRVSPNGSVLASLQVRLTQGIPGMQCPRPIDGAVATRSSALDSLFVKSIGPQTNVRALADQLRTIMTGKR
jgi:hypothetical protein